MGFINKRIDEIMQWVDGLSEREKRLLFLVGISFCLVLSLGSIFLAVTKLDQKETRLNRNKGYVAEIGQLSKDYLRAKARNQRAILRIKRNDVSLFSLLQSITNRLGLSVKDLSEQKRQLGKSDIVEVSVRLNLMKLSIDKLTALIEAIETSDYGDLVKVIRLKVNKRFDEPELLDLQMTVGTWMST